mgnify:FL=1
MGEVYLDRNGKEAIGMKDRKKQRANRKLKHKEQMLDKRDQCGVKNLTPYNAVQHMIHTNAESCRPPIADCCFADR